MNNTQVNNCQLSQTIGYASSSEEEAGRPTNLKSNDSLLGFIEVTDETALGLEREISNCFEENVFCLRYIILVVDTAVIKG